MCKASVTPPVDFFFGLHICETVDCCYVFGDRSYHIKTTGLDYAKKLG